MKERYVREPGDVEFVDQLIKSSVNLIGCIYGKVYFPTLSNSLKEVARYLGFYWTWARASGAATPLLRRAWELDADDEIKRELLGYNIADCRAAVIVADAIYRICGGGASSLNAVNTSSLEVGFQRTFGKLDCALPEFKKINDAAYWDYQRSKVYARTDKAVRQSVRKSRGGRQRVAVERELLVEGIPASCPRCQATKFWSHHNDLQVVIDLKFARRGIKRWAIRYRYKAYRCCGCRLEITTYSRKAKFGIELLAFIVYLLIEIASFTPEGGGALVVSV